MVNETVLSRMVKDFGDSGMRAIMEDLYGSGLAHLVVLIGGTLAFISLGFSLNRGESPRRAMSFFFAWFCCLPVGGKPLGYAVVNGIGSALAYQLKMTAVKLNQGVYNLSLAAPWSRYDECMFGLLTNWQYYVIMNGKACCTY